jgi:hypothetical protein
VWAGLIRLTLNVLSSFGEVESWRQVKVLGKYKIDVGDLLAQLTFSLYRIIADGVRVVRCQRKNVLTSSSPSREPPARETPPNTAPRCRSKRKN